VDLPSFRHPLRAGPMCWVRSKAELSPEAVGALRPTLVRIPSRLLAVNLAMAGGHRHVRPGAPGLGRFLPRGPLGEGGARRERWRGDAGAEGWAGQELGRILAAPSA